MLAADRSWRLGDVAKHLPFALDDADAVNETFARWTTQGDDRDLEALEVWSYCLARRYVYLRLVHSPHLANEADRMVGDIFLRIQSQFEKVDDPTRFTRWASVVCRNTFLNGLRRLHPTFELDDAGLADPDAHAPPGFAPRDRTLVRETVERAVSRLPDFLQPIARLRLIENRPYDEIAVATGHPVATVRTYTAKAVKRLREDPDLLAVARALDEAPT